MVLDSFFVLQHGLEHRDDVLEAVEVVVIDSLVLSGVRDSVRKVYHLHHHPLRNSARLVWGCESVRQGWVFILVITFG